MTVSLGLEDWESMVRGKSLLKVKLQFFSSFQFCKDMHVLHEWRAEGYQRSRGLMPNITCEALFIIQNESKLGEEPK